GGAQEPELATRLPVGLLALRQPLDEPQDDPRDVHVSEVERLLQDQRQEQVERALEGVEIQLELAHDHATHLSEKSGCAPSARPWRGPSARRASRAGGRSGPRRAGRTATR